MASKVQNGIQTLISITDKTAGPMLAFERRMKNTFRGVDKLKASLNRLDRVSGFGRLRTDVSSFSKSTRTAVMGLANITTSLGIIGIVSKNVINGLKGIATRGDEIGKSARRLGLGVEELQHFRFAAERSGVAVSVMDKSVQKMSIAYHKALSGMKGEKEMFNALGIDLKAGPMSNEDLLYSLSDAFKSIESPQKRLFVATSLFGEKATTMVELLSQGRDGMKGLISESKKYGVMTKEDTDNSEAFNDSLTNLNASFNSLKMLLGRDLLPVVTKSVDALTSMFMNNNGNIVKSFSGIIEQIPKLTETFEKALPGIIKAFSALIWVVDKFIGIFGVKWPIILAVVGAVIIPIIVSIASLIKLLYSFGKIVVTIFGAIFGRGKKVEKQAVQSVGRLTKIGNAFKLVGSKIFGALKAVFSGIGNFFGKVKPIGGKILKFFPKILRFLPMLGKAVGVIARVFGGSLLGPVFLAIEGFRVWKFVISEVLDNLDLLKSFNLDDLKFIFKEIGDFFKNIPFLGSLLKKIPGGFTSTVDFGDPGDISAELTASPFAQKAIESTKNINKNTKNSLDVNFNQVPQNVSVKKNVWESGNFGVTVAPAM